MIWQQFCREICPSVMLLLLSTPPLAVSSEHHRRTYGIVLYPVAAGLDRSICLRPLRCGGCPRKAAPKKKKKKKKKKENCLLITLFPCETGVTDPQFIKSYIIYVRNHIISGKKRSCAMFFFFRCLERSERAAADQRSHVQVQQPRAPRLQRVGAAQAGVRVDAAADH